MRTSRRSYTRAAGRWACAAVAVVALGAIAGAQPPGQERLGPEDVGRILTGSQAPIFRSGVTLVTTDIIPRDGNGSFIPDLTQDEITVLEDGHPQEIASLVLVHGGRVYNPAPCRRRRCRKASCCRRPGR